MITDAQLLFSEAAQYDVATATPETVTNFYDTGPLAAGNDGVDLGTGEELALYIRVTTTFAAPSTDGTIQIKLQSTATLPTPPTVFNTPTTHWDSGLIAEATLVAGYEIKQPLPMGQAWLRYVGFLVTAATQNFSAGALTIAIVPAGAISVQKQYASGLNFST